ncbi:hypothetical protein EVAR_53835_1 [Eumeta japonica]|uniref:Uncharacterized protein n=1 Tax=Eumeta variegata TaxID=151549 RepID=A0A4C1ZH66_EUMVA|nr:hypothetical protein EVAR_53835_1 [Eumeta japonica]
MLKTTRGRGGAIRVLVEPLQLSGSAEIFWQPLKPSGRPPTPMNTSWQYGYAYLCESSKHIVIVNDLNAKSKAMPKDVV